MSYEINYAQGGYYTLTIGETKLHGFTSYSAAEEAAQVYCEQLPPVKRVTPVRDGRTTEYEMFLDGEYVGSRRTRIEADQYLDRLVFDRLSGRSLVEGR